LVYLAEQTRYRFRDFGDYRAVEYERDRRKKQRAQDDRDNDLNRVAYIEITAFVGYGRPYLFKETCCFAAGCAACRDNRFKHNNFSSCEK